MSVSNEVMSNDVLERQRRVRRTTWWLVAVALVFYVGFIVMSVSSSHG